MHTRIRLLASTLVLACIVVCNLSATDVVVTRGFKYTLVPSSTKKCKIYFTAEPGASEDKKLPGAVEWDDEGLETDGGSLYLNVESDAAQSIKLTFPVFSDASQQNFIPYTIEVAEMGGTQSVSQEVPAEKDAVATFDFQDLGGVVDKEYRLHYSFQKGAVSGATEGSYSSTISVEVTML